MAVVLHELQQDQVENAALQEDLSLLRKQVDHCKHILSVLVDKASQSATSSISAITIQALIARVLEQWQLLRPGSPLAVIDMAGVEHLAVADDPALDQALLNLLDNAADASSQTVTLQVQAQQDSGRSWCCIEILDQGPGIDDAVVARLGEPFITTKSETGGMGIGLFLSNATLERLGGRVEIVNREEGGACTRILLPALKEEQA
jgi:two-component system sensor histidine kinase RegB